MANLLIALGGGTLLVVVALDIFRSLLVPRASGRLLRVGPALTMLLFPSWHLAASRIRGARLQQTFRASLAPLMLVLTMILWAALMIVGFGLVFWADRGNFAPAFHHLGDALYAAGSAFSTLGISGTVSGDRTRLLVLICSVAGLAVVTVVATFLISIQGGFGRRETMVLRMEAHVTLPPAGIAILETYAREAIVERLGAFFDAWEQWAAEVAVSHRAFPILIFFRSNDSRCEWLAAFGAVLDAAALLDTTVADVPAAVRAGAHFVFRTGAHMLECMADQLGSAGEQTLKPADRSRFQLQRERLAKAGYALVEDERAAFAAFERRRGSYFEALGAIAQRLRIDVDEQNDAEIESEPQNLSPN